MLHCAASKGRFELVEYLLENEFQDNPNVRNDLGETPLHLAAAYFTKGNLPINHHTKMLLSKISTC